MTGSNWKKYIRSWLQSSLRSPNGYRAQTRKYRSSIELHQLEDRVTPAFLGGVSVAAGDINADGFQDIVTGPGIGGGPHVRVFSGETGQSIADFFAYDISMTSGLNVAVGDVTGDKRPDIITAPGVGGGPLIRVFDGSSLALVEEFFAFDSSFRGGCSVAVGDIDGNGTSEIITGMLSNGSEVRVFSASGAAITTFSPFSPGFGGGSWVATTDLDGDQKSEIVVGAAGDGSPRVRVISGDGQSERLSFSPYESEFKGSVHVSGGDVDGDGFGDIITSPGFGGGPRVRVFNGKSASGSSSTADFFAYTEDFRGGASIATADLDQDGRFDVITGAGKGGSSHVRAFRSEDRAELANFIAYDPEILGNAFSKRKLKAPSIPIAANPSTNGNSGTGVNTVPPVPPVVPNPLILSEGDNFITETSQKVLLSSITKGTRTLTFDISASLDRSDKSGIEDVFNIFIVDAANRSKTLIDRGVQGTSVFSLVGDRADLAVEAGVRFDGKSVEIDVTNLVAPDGANLILQLVNMDSDTGSKVEISEPRYIENPDGVVGPKFPQSESIALKPGKALGLVNTLTKADSVRGELSNVRFDPTNKTLTADLVVENQGNDLGRNLVVRFNDLPAGVSLANASGVDNNGRSYLNLLSAVPIGGLGNGERSRPVEVRFNNPNLTRFTFGLTAAAGENSAPVIGEPDGALTVLPGEILRRTIPLSDLDGDPLTITTKNVDGSSQLDFPVFSLDPTGQLVVVARPDQVGNHKLTLTVSDGATRVTSEVTIQVQADPDTRTRISGRLLNTEDQPLGSVRVAVGKDSATTDLQGNFVLPLTSIPPTGSTVKLAIFGNEILNPVAYHYVEMPLNAEIGFLGRKDVFQGANNQIANPIYLQAIDLENAVFVDPSQETIVRSKEDGLRLTIPSQSLRVIADGKVGEFYTGKVSLSIVNEQKTPMPLSREFLPEYVITFQPVYEPGQSRVELQFDEKRPGQLLQPYDGPLPEGTAFDLIGFDADGVMKKLGDAKIIPTPADPGIARFSVAAFSSASSGNSRSIASTTNEAGLRSGACDFYVPQATNVSANDSPKNPDEGCECCTATGTATSDIELHSGALREQHTTSSYKSQGVTRAVTLTYDSMRADPRPIINFSASGFSPLDLSLLEDVRLTARLGVSRGTSSTTVSGAVASTLNPNGGEHFWRIAEGQTSYQAALQADLRNSDSGRYSYTLEAGLLLNVRERLRGRMSQQNGTFISVNSIDSPFGSGWGIAGLQWLSIEKPLFGIDNADGTADEGGVLLIDGDGTQLFFRKKGNTFIAPPGDFSTLEMISGGRYRRTLPDQTTYLFNAALDLESMRDRNGNTTTFRYDAPRKITEIEDPVGLKTTFTYGTNGKVTEIVLPDGRKTIMEYDPVGNLRSVTDPDGAKRTWSYDVDHRMIGEQDARGNRESSIYNFAGRVVQARLKDGSIKRFSPVQSQALYSPERTTSFADAPLAQTITPAESFVADANGNVEGFTLDRAGQVVQSRNWEGNQSTFVRNSSNLVTRSDDSRGNATLSFYDGKGNPTEILDNLAITSTTRRDSIGREFWVSFQRNVDTPDKQTLQLFISGYTSTTGLVEIPGIGFSEEFAVTPGQVTQVIVPNEAIIGKSDTVASLGIRISALRPITVVGVNNLRKASEAFLALPTDVLGTDYLVMSSENDSNRNTGSYFAVIATTDNTILTITPSAGSSVKAPGVPYNVRLNRGQTYYLEDSIGNRADLTGTQIVATDPVAVLSGHRCANVPFDVGFCNHLVEQLTPTSSWGTSFVTTPVARRIGGDVIRVLAATNNTQVRVNGQLVATLNRGQFYQQFITPPTNLPANQVSPFEITASNPVLVAQFATGSQRGGNPGDPLMLLLPPTNQYIETQTISKPAGFSTNFITIVIPTAALPTLNINGTSFGDTIQSKAAFYAAFPAEQLFPTDQSNKFSIGVLQYNADQPLTISARDGFGLYVYGYGTDDNYGFLGGQSFEPFNRRKMSYDSTFNQLTEMTDELGHVTTNRLDSKGNVIETRRVMNLPDGKAGDTQLDLVTTYTYVPSGQIDTMTDPLGRITDYDYDQLGRLITITSAKGTVDETVMRYEYFDGMAGLSGNVKAMIDGRGNRTEYEYDTMNRVVKVTEADPNGSGSQSSPVTEMKYDENGNLVESKDALGSITTFVYDTMNRRAATIAPDPDGAGPLAAPVTRMTYEPNGNLRSAIDPNGNTTEYRYDERLRRIETIDSDGGVTRFRYDLDNNLVSLQDPGGNLTQFVYDYRGRQTAEIDPLGKTTTYTFDAANRLDAMTDRLGRTIDYSYDDANRMIKEEWVGGGNTVNYTYDAAGNLNRVQDAFSSLAFAFDNLNRTKSVDNAGTPGAPQVLLGYEYDDNSNVTLVRDRINGAEGATTKYEYDALNRLSKESQSGPNVTEKRVEFGYNAIGQYTAMTRFVGTQSFPSTAYTYDDMHRLKSITHGSAADPVQFFNYAYDSGSRITQIASKTDTVNYGYDKRDQLTKADYAGNSQTDENYRYDSNGNRLESQRHGKGYKTDPNTANRLKSDGTYNYEYDNNGNQIRRTRISGAEENGSTVREFAWDYRNRLIRVTDRASAGGVLIQEVTFTYDALDRRIAKTSGGVTTHFVYDREDVLLEFNGSTLATRNFHGPGIDQVLTQESNGAVQWLLTDHLGSTRAVVGANGAVQLVEYDAYGNPVGAMPTRYGFTGREWEAETGLWYYRARYYDAAAGRFASEDPIDFLAGFNRYWYVNNQPSRFIDPTGMLPDLGCVATAAGLGCAGGAAVGAGAGASVGAPVGGTLGTVGGAVGGMGVGAVPGGFGGAAAGGGIGAGLGAVIGCGIGGGLAAVGGIFACPTEPPSCDQKPRRCLPCNPPVGTYGYRTDFVPPSQPHYPFTGTHTHIYVVMQSPPEAGCKCFWHPLAPIGGAVPPPGAVPVTGPVGGGGIA
jgi:RHS repeat-associated protein